MRSRIFASSVESQSGTSPFKLRTHGRHISGTASGL